MENQNPTQTTEVVVAHRAMEVAEIESQIATAKRYPRDIQVFKDKLMAMANIDQETAEGCYYALPHVQLLYATPYSRSSPALTLNLFLTGAKKLLSGR